MRLRDKIRYAQTLAEFANLELSGLERFRRNESDFVPKAWWDYQPTDSDGKPRDRKQWQINQEMLREAWQKQFRIGQWELMRLLTSVFDPNNLTDVMLGARNRPLFATLNEIPEEMFPYQQAVLFLVGHDSHAWLCERCKAPFFRTHNQGKYCSVPNEEGQTCTSLARAEGQKQDRKKHRDERNTKRRMEYAEKKRNRRNHAERKNLRQR